MNDEKKPVFLKVWGAPIALGLLTCFGLLAALLGVGLWHWSAWLALSIPLITGIRFWIVPRQTPFSAHAAPQAGTKP